HHGQNRSACSVTRHYSYPLSVNFRGNDRASSTYAEVGIRRFEDWRLEAGGWGLGLQLFPACISLGQTAVPHRPSKSCAQLNYFRNSLPPFAGGVECREGGCHDREVRASCLRMPGRARRPLREILQRTLQGERGIDRAPVRMPSSSV